MLKELNYKVNGQTLTGESFKMASDTVNEIKVSFAFEGTDWSGLDSIKAVFSSNRIGNSYEVVLTNGSCIIPHEVLTEKGTVSVNLYGSIITGTTLTTRITSYKSACVDVLQKVNVSGSNSVVPTPATWEQELSAHTQNTTVHVTAQNKADWNAKLSDAPADSKLYGRKNGTWKEVEDSGTAAWGQITGTLADQTDLATALDGKANASHTHTKSQITDFPTLADVATSGDYDDLLNKPTIPVVPTNVSAFTNDAGYLTEHQSLSAYRTSSAQDVIDDAIEADIDAIEAKIPSQASSSNQLADKAFVNSSIGTNTANYISNNGQPFNSLAELEAYTGTVTNNDYAFVTGTDEQGNTYFDRYKASVSGTTVTWAKEYRMNNSSFTSAQWSAINSGITSLLVSKLNGIEAGAEVNAVDSVNGHTGVVVLDAEDVGAMPSGTFIPTKTSDLTNDSGFLTQHQSLSGYATQVWVGQQGYLTQHQDISGKENTSNKVTSISASSTNTEYPSAKCVYDVVGNVESLLEALL